MPKDVFYKFLERAQPDPCLDGIVKSSNVILATDARVTLWGNGDDQTAARILDEEIGGRIVKTVVDVLNGDALGTAAISQHNLWMLGQTLGKKGSIYPVFIQVRGYAENAPILLAATKTHGMVIMPIRQVATAESAPFLFWGLDDE